MHRALMDQRQRSSFHVPEAARRIAPVVLSGVLFVAASAAAAEPSTVPAPPALYASAAELIASVGAASAASNLTKGVRVARAGKDRVSIDVLKRTSPEEGPVVHLAVTEIYQVLTGGGTLETGGTLIGAETMLGPDGKPLNPESIGPSVRGKSTTGGQSRHITVGDTVLIPPGTPHRFTHLDGEITYMVIRYNPGWYANN